MLEPFELDAIAIKKKCCFKIKINENLGKIVEVMSWEIISKPKQHRLTSTRIRSFVYFSVYEFIKEYRCLDFVFVFLFSPHSISLYTCSTFNINNVDSFFYSFISNFTLMLLINEKVNFNS